MSAVVGETKFVADRRIPVACVQPRAHDRADFGRRLPSFLSSIDAAARRGAKLIVLPEGTVPGYVLGTSAVAAEQLRDAHEALCGLARETGTVIVYGAARHADDGRVFNVARVIGPDGRDLGAAAKQFLWHFDRRWFAPGTTLDPIETPLGRLGVFVCADGRIPTIASTLVERGAELLVMPTAWVTSGRDPAALENLQADLLAQVRARENRVPFVVANKCGVELEGVAYCGKSAIIDASGAYVARAPERAETVLLGEVRLGGESGREAREPVRVPAALPSGRPMRVAFTPAGPDAGERFAELAALADAHVVIVHGETRGRARVAAALPILGAADPAPERARLAQAGDARVCIVGDDAFTDPAALVPARLAGIDLYVWCAGGEPAWHVPFARTRAAELRAYVVTFSAGGRAFACDPDGAVVAGTFDDYRLASFAYDPARTASGLVAPHTDVFAGMRAAEAIREAGRGTPV